MPLVETESSVVATVVPNAGDGNPAVGGETRRTVDHDRHRSVVQRIAVGRSRNSRDDPVCVSHSRPGAAWASNWIFTARSRTERPPSRGDYVRMTGDILPDKTESTRLTSNLREVRELILLRGDRTVISLGIIGVFLTTSLGLSLFQAFPFSDLQAVYYVYGGLISGNLTLITVVVSVNQLLLSREFSTPGELERQISDMIDYRRDVEDAAGQVAPVEPLEFLRLLLEATRQESQALGGLVRGTDVAAAEEIVDVVATLTEELDRTDELLVERSSGTIDVLSAMLTTNYARQINALRRTKHDSEGLPDPVEDSIDRLIDHLQSIDIARQYFKTVYFKQELSSFSRVLLVAGLPAEGIAIASLLLMSVPSGNPTAVAHLRTVVPVTTTLALTPLAVLASFIVRTATVNRRTAATVPFTAPEQEK